MNRKGMTRDAIVAKAAPLFTTQSYREASLTGLAAALDLSPSSLYHFFPGGKEELYLATVEQRFMNFRAEVARLAQTAGDLAAFLTGLASWYAEQTPMSMDLIMRVNLIHLSHRGQDRVVKLGAECLIMPLAALWGDRFAAETRPDVHPLQAAGLLLAFLGVLERDEALSYSRADSRQNMLSIFLYGIARQHETK